MEVGVPGEEKDIDILGVIPARFESSRFPGKPLIEICGVPMIKRTYLQAQKSRCLDELVVATDHKKISDYCNSEKIPVVMTTSSCLTGTDRLAEVAEKAEYSNYDVYINIQGDEPVIDPQAIDQIANECIKNKYKVYNLYKHITDEELINSNTIIKVVVNEGDEVMYMSRLPIPFSKSEKAPNYKQQIPVYAFDKEALTIFSSSPKTINEQFEDIELLRFVDKGIKIKMLETNADSISVDVPEDIERVVTFLNSSR